MKAIIELDVPEWQIGQDVTVYFPDTMSKKGKCQKAIKQEDKQNEEPNERWLLTHEVVNEEEDILRWTWCGLFRTREPALKLLKKNVKRIVDEYDERFPEIRVNEDEETLEENVLIGRTDRFQRFRLLKLIEEP